MSHTQASLDWRSIRAEKVYLSLIIHVLLHSTLLLSSFLPMMYGGGGNRGMTLRMGEESSRAEDRERGGGGERGYC